MVDLEIAHIIAAAASCVAAVCNLVLLILLIRWYWPNGDMK